MLSVTGKAYGVTRIVCGVVYRLQRRETGHPDEQGPEQDRRDPVTQRVAPTQGRPASTAKLILPFVFSTSPKRAAACFYTGSASGLAKRGIAVKHYAKPTNTRVAPLPLQQQIAAEVDLVIEGLSD